VKDIPKNKAGKPARNLIKAKALGQNLGDASAVSNPDAINDIPLISK